MNRLKASDIEFKEFGCKYLARKKVKGFPGVGVTEFVPLMAKNAPNSA